MHCGMLRPILGPTSKLRRRNFGHGDLQAQESVAVADLRTWAAKLLGASDFLKQNSAFGSAKLGQNDTQVPRDGRHSFSFPMSARP